ncbi:MAG: response regulator [Chitinivibrionales bacterium]
MTIGGNTEYPEQVRRLIRFNYINVSVSIFICILIFILLFFFQNSPAVLAASLVFFTGISVYNFIHMRRSAGVVKQEFINIKKEIKRQHQSTRSLELRNKNFIYNISHEIRTPLTSVLGFSEMLLEEESDPGRVRKLNNIQVSCNNLLTLVNQILDYSDMEQGNLRIDKGVFSVKDLAEKIDSRYKDFAEKKGIAFYSSVDTGGKEWFVSDERLIIKVLNSILDNAVKFTDEGRVSFDIRYQNRNLDVYVSDTGVGIDKGVRDMVYDAYYQAEPTQTRKHSGVGLGLALSRKVIELMGGKIDLDSSVGRGTAFSIVIPVDEADNMEGVQIRRGSGRSKEQEKGEMVKGWFSSLENPGRDSKYLKRAIQKMPSRIDQLREAIQNSDEEQGAKVIHEIKGLSGMVGMKDIYDISAHVNDIIKKEGYDPYLVGRSCDRMEEIIKSIPPGYFMEGGEMPPRVFASVLIVEDDDINLQMLVDYLADTGIESDTARNGKEALEKLARKKYNAVLLDVEMPILNGLSTLRIIRSNRDYNSIQVAFITAEAEYEFEQKCREAGCDEFMQKPVTRKVLCDRVMKLVHKSNFSKAFPYA